MLKTIYTVLMSFLEKMPYNRIIFIINLECSVFTEISNFGLEALTLELLGQYSMELV